MIQDIQDLISRLGAGVDQCRDGIRVEKTSCDGIVRLTRSRQSRLYDAGRVWDLLESESLIRAADFDCNAGGLPPGMTEADAVWLLVAEAACIRAAA